MSERSDLECLADLGLAPGASFEEVKKTYRVLAMKSHPDRHPENSPQRLEQQEKFKRYSVSYAALARRESEGRWNEKWDSGRGPAPRRAQPAPEAPRARPGRAPGGWGFSFAYGGGAVGDVAMRFFKSYLQAAARVAAGEPGRDRAQGVRELAEGYLNVFELYTGLTRLDLSLFKMAFLRHAWGSQAPGVISVLFEACEAVGRRARGQEEIIDAVSPGVSLFKPALVNSYFSILDELATPRGSGVASASERLFHEEIASQFKSVFAPAEAFEQENADFLKRQSELLFAQRLLRDRPELFEIYHQAGWIDLAHPLYAQRKAEIAMELLQSEKISWEGKARMLGASLGARGCVALLRRLEAFKAPQAALAFEELIIAQGAQGDLPERLWTPKMALGKRSEALYWELKRKSLPSWLGRAAGWLGREPDPVARAFEAAATGQIERFEVALSDCKSAQRSALEIAREGVPLAQFVAWRDAFEPGDEAFCAAALDALKSRFGGAILRQSDPFGSCALEWVKRKISAAAAAFERGEFSGGQSAQEDVKKSQASMKANRKGQGAKR